MQQRFDANILGYILRYVWGALWGEVRTYEYNKVLEILQRGDDAAFFDDEPRSTKPFEPVEHQNIRGGVRRAPTPSARIFVGIVGQELRMMSFFGENICVCAKFFVPLQPQRFLKNEDNIDCGGQAEFHEGGTDN